MPFLILSASLSSLTPEENNLRTRDLREYLKKDPNLTFLPCRGCYTHSDGAVVYEDSFLIVPDNPWGRHAAFLLAGKFGQESILEDTNGTGRLHYLADGRIQPLGQRQWGTAPGGWTSTTLGDFYYA